MKIEIEFPIIDEDVTSNNLDTLMYYVREDIAVLFNLHISDIKGKFVAENEEDTIVLGIWKKAI